MSQHNRKIISYVLVTLCLVQSPGMIHAWPKPFRSNRPALVVVSEQIDCLERQLNTDGTVIIKAPDIWGESRLTKHRQEFEKVMARELDDFSLHLNASIRRSDQSFLANALAIQAALVPHGKSQHSNIPQATTAADQTNIHAFVQTLTTQDPAKQNDSSDVKINPVITRSAPHTLAGNTGLSNFTESNGKLNIGLEPTIRLDQLKRYLDHLHEIRRVNEGDDTADSPGYSLNLVRVPVSIMPGEQTRQGHGAEITITAKPHLSPELLPRVFRELVINDLIDLLALPVLKIADEFERANTIPTPNSEICEGFRQYEHLFLFSPEENIIGIIENTNPKRDINDYDKRFYKNGKLSLREYYQEQEDEIIAHIANTTINNAIRAAEAAAEAAKRSNALSDANQSKPSARAESNDKFETAKKAIDNITLDTFKFDNSDRTDSIRTNILNNLDQKKIEEINRYTYSRFNLNEDEKNRVFNNLKKLSNYPEIQNSEDSGGIGKLSPDEKKESRERRLASSIEAVVNKHTSSVANSNVTRNSRQPLPPSQIAKVFGNQSLLRISYEFWKTTQHKNVRHLMDAQGFLKEQLEASYDYLSTPEGSQYWQNIPEIHQQVREDRLEFNKILFDFSGKLTHYSASPPVRKTAVAPLMVPPVHPIGFTENTQNDEWKHAPSPLHNPLNETPVKMGAWWILVESALLNQKLNDDMKRVSQDPNCFCHPEEHYAFYSSTPAEEAKMAFIDYVNCRWPIHVFALDPVVQQQNIADSYSMRQEMQLALALAFAGGKINAQNMMKYVRRLEIDMETIALNHTVAAFGHGSDTFGWRFFPRVQTPPFESNATVVFRNMLWGGPSKDHLRKHWEIEPGMRECVAVVLMPSFIEHLTFHTRGNYFKMKNQKNVKSSMVENANWSQNIREMQMTLEQLHCEADLYRHGEVERVNHRVEQLAKKLPMQTVHSRVPNENTLGGFEMFSAGTSDLGPELYGYYGTPGVDPNQDTTVYLVGNHFSIHETRVLAGNRNCEFHLLSRQVMEVKIPAGVQIVKDKFSEHPECPGRHVDVHVATPYGVSRQIEIPLIREASNLPTAFRWKAQEMDVCYRYTTSRDNNQSPLLFTIENSDILVKPPHELAIKAPAFAPTGASIKLTAQLYVDIEGCLPCTSDCKSHQFLEKKQGIDSLPITETSSSTSLIFDQNKKEYVMPTSSYSKFQQEVRDRVKSHYDKQKLKDLDTFPPQLNVYVKATITEQNIDIPGYLLIKIHNIKK